MWSDSSGSDSGSDPLPEGGSRFEADAQAALRRGINLRAEGDLRSSLAVLEALLGDCVRVYGREHKTTRQAMSHLARTLHALGESRRASGLFGNVARSRRERRGSSHPCTLNSTALWYEAIGVNATSAAMAARWKEILQLFLDLVRSEPASLGMLLDDFLRIVGAHLDALDDPGLRDFATALFALARAERDGGDVRGAADEVLWMAEVMEYESLRKQLAGGGGAFVGEGKDTMSLSLKDTMSLSVKDTMSLSRRIPGPKDVLSLSSRGPSHLKSMDARRSRMRLLDRFTKEELHIGADQVRHEPDPAGGSQSVDCTVFGPPGIARRQTVMMQVFGHRPGLGEEIAQIAREFDFEAIRRGTVGLNVKLRTGSRITCHLEIPDLDVDEPVQVLEWSGRTSSVQFTVSAPARARLGTRIGKLTVSFRGVPRGHIKFRIDVTRKPGAGDPAPLGEIARHYRNAFVSYASEDRVDVLKRVQMLALLDIAAFQDVLHLSPGDRWEQQLYTQIGRCDLFLLFWSRAARESRYVRKELRHALGLKKKDANARPEIIPIVLGPPPPPAPPKELKHLHFDDFLIYMIEGLERR